MCLEKKKKMKRTLFDFNFQKKTAGSVDETQTRQENEERTQCIDANDGDGQNSEGPPSSKKIKTKSFQDSWLTKWPWLVNTGKGMQCSLCLKYKKDNAFTSSECTNYRTSTFIRHASTSDHTDALRAEALQKDFKQVCLYLFIYIHLSIYRQVRFH